jgi:hypothetical protein
MTPENSASDLISAYIASQTDWRGSLLARLRALILETAPGITEEWKWDSPVWSQNGNVVSASAFKEHVKLNFFKGAALSDPQGLFNAGLEAKASRGIDFHAGEVLNVPALQELIRVAVAYNLSGSKKK